MRRVGETGGRGTAQSVSSLPMTARRVDAFNVSREHTDDATSVGFLIRSLYAFLTQLPCFLVPKVEQLSERAPETISGHGERSPDENFRTVAIWARNAWRPA